MAPRSSEGSPVDQPLIDLYHRHVGAGRGGGLAGGRGYDADYRAPFDGGRALVLVRDDRLTVAERKPLARVLTVFPQVISALPVFEHRAAIRSYAESYGIHVADEA